MQAEEEEEEAIQEKRYNFAFVSGLGARLCLSLFRAGVVRTAAAPRSAPVRAKAAFGGGSWPIFTLKTLKTTNRRECPVPKRVDSVMGLAVFASGKV